MKYFYSLVILSMTFFTFSQSEVFLKGKITNYTHDKVTLSQVVMEDGHATKKDLAVSEVKKDGTFDLHFSLTEQVEAIFSDGNERTTVLLQPGDEIYMTLNTKMFDETISYYGKGAEKNNAIKNMALMMEQSINPVFEFDPETDTTEVFSYIDNAMEKLTEMVKDYQSLEDFKVYGEKLIKEYAGTAAGLKAQYKQNLEMKKVFAKMIGTEAIDIKGIDLSDKEVSLVDYKGKLTIVDFWATWCAPCKAEMPAFIELEEKYGKEVNFVSMAVYCKEDAWKKMAADYGFENNIYVSKATQDQFADWQVNFIPRYFVIGKDFKVIDSDAPRPSSGELETMIKELK
ncbi:MAG: TlpA family protein disulfide reductase [Fluviicola sp.]|nr:TlpA family protein disulfide reductase [Fluviicola sp.]